MNTSSYVMYQNHTLYKFKNQTETIGIQPVVVPHIDMQNFICFGPPNYNKVIVSDDMVYSPPASMNYADSISRPDIFQPSYNIANLPQSDIAKNDRQGFSGSVPANQSRRLFFARGRGKDQVSVSVPTPTPTPPPPGVTLNNFNSIWNTINFRGFGTSEKPYIKGTLTTSNAAGMQFTAVLSGTLHIVCTNMIADNGIDIYKNGILQSSPPTIPDSTPDEEAGNYNVNIIVAVLANDIIKIGNSSNNHITWNSRLSIWLQQ